MTRNERDFEAWLSEFQPIIASFDYYVDFDKCIENARKWNAELHLMDSLLGSKSIEQDFLALCAKYPDVLKVVPTLLAVRQSKVPVLEAGILTEYNFGKKGEKNSPQEYADFMRATGLFDIMEHHAVSSLSDYVTGVEVGLDSNGRKNRGGHLMENLVESYLVQAGLKRREVTDSVMLDGQVETGVYFKEFYANVAMERWGIDLSAITNNGKGEKRFDFVVKVGDELFGIETNFYSGGGSKLNETARSYKTITQEAAAIDGFTFVWVTDGAGWKSARGNLRETFEVLNTVYNLADLERGAFKELFGAN